MKNDIPYSITGGTLFSAAVKKRLSRLDSVAHIVIPEAYSRKLVDLAPEFKDLSLMLDDLPGGGYKLSSFQSLPFLSKTHVIISPVINAGDRWIAKDRASLDEWYKLDELFPVRPYKVGILSLPGPANPLPYLERNYFSLGLGLPRTVKKYVNVPRRPILNRDQRYILNDIRGYPGSSPGEFGIPVGGIPIGGVPIGNTGKGLHRNRNKQVVVMGNGRTIEVPIVGGNCSPQKKCGRWRRLLWN
jgi:hypothetical protein